MTAYNCFVRWSKASFLPGNAQLVWWEGGGGQAELRLNKVFNGETPAGSPNPYPFKLYTIIFNIKGTTSVYF